MRTHGRKSVAELATPPSVVQGTFGKRPEPPAELTERQAAIWRDTVAGEDTSFFGTAALRGLLKHYCIHMASAEDVTSIIDSFKPEWLRNEEGARRYHLLLKMRDLETRAAADKATKLRLTNQSRYTPQAAGTAGRNAAKGFMPWDDEA